MPTKNEISVAIICFALFGLLVAWYVDFHNEQYEQQLELYQKYCKFQGYENYELIPNGARSVRLCFDNFENKSEIDPKEYLIWEELILDAREEQEKIAKIKSN